MNQFLFEIKSQIKVSLIWIVSIVLIMVGLLWGVYPIFEESTESFKKIMEGFPAGFADAFGLELMMKVFSFKGYYNFTYTYVGLIGGIMASGIGVSLFAREKKDKCLDFLLTKPISRESVFLNKFLSGFLIILVTNVVYVCSSVWIGASFSVKPQEMFLLSSSLFWTMLVFYSIGICYSIFVKKIRSVAGIATAFGFGAFIISALVNLLDEEKIRIFAPLKYFDPADILVDNAFDVKFAALGVAVILISLIASFLYFCQSDTHAV